MTALGQSVGVINVEHWAEIRRLHMSEHMGVKAIGRRLGLARNTVRAALASQAPPKYERERAGSRVDGFEAAIRRLLAEFPDMPATVIAERIGWVCPASDLVAGPVACGPDLLKESDRHGGTAGVPGGGEGPGRVLVPGR